MEQNKLVQQNHRTCLFTNIGLELNFGTSCSKHKDWQTVAILINKSKWFEVQRNCKMTKFQTQCLFLFEQDNYRFIYSCKKQYREIPCILGLVYTNRNIMQNSRTVSQSGYWHRHSQDRRNFHLKGSLMFLFYSQASFLPTLFPLWPLAITNIKFKVSLKKKKNQIWPGGSLIYEVFSLTTSLLSLGKLNFLNIGARQRWSPLW